MANGSTGGKKGKGKKAGTGKASPHLKESLPDGIFKVSITKITNE